MKLPLIIAHRGASAYAPENTIAAFIKALEMGAGGIELDVQLSRDGYPVVIHDERIDRISDGSGWVKDKTLKELQTLDFGSWFSPFYQGETIPTLEQVMEILAEWDILLNIELKNGPVFYPGIEEKVISLVKRFQMEDRVIISSFNHYSIVEVKKIAENIKIAPVYMAGLYKPWNYAKELNAAAVHPYVYGLMPEIIKGCKENGIDINTFTVDEPEDIKRLAAAGVDGIITNVPDVALSIVRKNGREIKNEPGL